MESEFTTKIQLEQNLSDVYFMTCLESTRKVEREVRLAGTAAKILLALTLAQGVGCYAAETDIAVPSKQIKYELYMGQKNMQTGSLSDFDNGKLSIEVNQASSFKTPTRKAKNTVIDKIERAQRVQKIMDSYAKNKSAEPRSVESNWVMKMANTALSKLPFNDVILQYESYDDVWQYNLFFKGDLELSVGVFVEGETIGEVDFNIYQGNELIVANMLPLNQLVRKMKTVISKVQNNA